MEGDQPSEGTNRQTGNHARLSLHPGRDVPPRKLPVTMGTTPSPQRPTVHTGFLCARHSLVWAVRHLAPPAALPSLSPPPPCSSGPRPLAVPQARGAPLPPGAFALAVPGPGMLFSQLCPCSVPPSPPRGGLSVSLYPGLPPFSPHHARTEALGRYLMFASSTQTPVGGRGFADVISAVPQAARSWCLLNECISVSVQVVGSSLRLSLLPPATRSCPRNPSRESTADAAGRKVAESWPRSPSVQGVCAGSPSRQLAGAS